jgi:serine protease AprX
VPEIYLPLKVVWAHKDRDYRMDPNSGGQNKIFEPVTAGLRRQFVADVGKVQSAFAQSFKTQPTLPAVAKVELKPEAVAKSHRPTVLFNEQTCPIIGVDKPGELLVSVNPAGLERLIHELADGRTVKHRANISTLKHLLPFKSADALDGETPEVIASSARRDRQPIRVQLFRHASDELNKRIDKQARELAESQKISEFEELDYGEGIRVFAIRGASAQAVRALSEFVGTQGIGLFPDFRIVRTAAHIVGALEDKRFPAPNPNADYALVGVIDTGTDPNNKRLQAFVVKREVWVQTGQDNDHGSFVAGLIANARALNSGNQRFPSAQSRIVDIVALDETGTISEYDLITVIDRAVRAHKHVKVWNLSLGQSKPCRDGRFSLLACKLDSIAKKHGVLFVISAGNYEKPPLRGWPPDDLNGEDRICPPADSVRNLTVGSMAHISHATTCVGVDEPSGFSRRGPAPHFYIKPEVSHYGGNCDENGDCLQCGIVSTDGSGNLAENIGTSFAAPSISTIAANMFRELEPEGEVTPTFIKGLLVHAAFVRSGRSTDDEVRHRGFGSPGDLSDVLNCKQSSATVIFHAAISDRQFFEKHDFRCHGA